MCRSLSENCLFSIEGGPGVRTTLRSLTSYPVCLTQSWVLLKILLKNNTKNIKIPITSSNNTISENQLRRLCSCHVPYAFTIRNAIHLYENDATGINYVFLLLTYIIISIFSDLSYKKLTFYTVNYHSATRFYVKIVDGSLLVHTIE